MDLNRWDDLPFHQTVAPLGVPATSDSHFNDGYYFAWYRPGWHGFCGLRLHPNNNVCDGYAGVVTGGQQRGQRFSRALLPDKDRLVVGPLRVEIAEPMERQVVTLDQSEVGLAFEIELTASAPPFVETGHKQWRYGRLLNDIVRYTQVARASGHMTVEGETETVDAWHACRDHSWGIRSTMGPHVPIDGVGWDGDQPDRRAMRLWVPFELDDHAGFFHTHEDNLGVALDFEGRLDFAGGRSVALAGVRHQLEYHPDSQRLQGGALTLTDVEGIERDYEFEVVNDPAHPQGFGYTRGWSDGGQPGVYRGATHSEWDVFAVDDPAVVAAPDHVPPERRLGGTEFAATLRGPGGATGMAHVEHMLYGPRT